MYISAKGQKVDPKHYVDFSCGCKRKCTEKISKAMRQNLFSQFWTIGPFPGRCAFLNGIIREVPKKRAYTKNKESKRQNSRKYFIEGSEVCKTTILKTFQITQNRIDVALKKNLKSIIQDDRRVKSGGRINHINSFPTYISHYCRRETEAKYLNPDLNLAQMYDLYKDFSAEDKLVSLSTYKSIFYTKCNLKFKSPKQDTCLACDTYKAKIVSLHGEEREKLEKQHKEHIDKAQTLRKDNER
ncbi:hypothetical protein QE152_g36688 [Popillia japonica]|uniref:Site-specific DNA endonuclease n=1 Tax=Popillia japonica TaxID=7064 RepID=A0AAW1ICC3_POPJA